MCSRWMTAFFFMGATMWLQIHWCLKRNMSTTLHTRSGKWPVTASGKRDSKWQKKVSNAPKQNKEHLLLTTGHKTWFWCYQDQSRKSKAIPSQREGAVHRDTLRMHCYDCQSQLNILYRANLRSEETYTISVWLEHHIWHTPYYDVGFPHEAAALIWENLEWSSPNEVVRKLMLTYPSISTNQIHTAWTTMSRTLWKQDREQLHSVKVLLGELKDDIAILDLPATEGVEQIAWVMKNIVAPLRGKIIEIGIDATCKWPLKRQRWTH